MTRGPLGNIFSFTTQCLFRANVAARRFESSYRRTKKRLNVKPDPSFSSENNIRQQDHIIFNPPSSAPSVLHTPLTFLPKEDPRRQLFANAATSTLARSKGPLAPEIHPKPPTYQRYHLSEEDAAEMRRLHHMDPVKYSIMKLAKKYECNFVFARLCCKSPPEVIEATKARLAEIRSRWGPKKVKAQEDRARRWQAVWRDE